MPTVQGTPVQNYSGTARSSITQAVTVSTGSGNLAMVVSLSCEEAATVFSGATFNGVAMTSLGSAASATWSKTQMFALLAPTVGTFNVVATATSARVIGVSIIVLEGVHQTTGWRTAVTATTNAAVTLSATVASVASTDLLIDHVTLDSLGHSPVAGLNQTAAFATQSLAGTEARGSTQSGADGGVMSWTWTTSTEGALVTNAFIAVAGGGGVTVKNLAALGVG